MQTLRNAHLIACFMLVWFALSIGVAIASPLVKPPAMTMIVLNADDGNQQTSRPTLDCPLCAPARTRAARFLLNSVSSC